MKFIVCETRYRPDGDAPCEGAVKGQYGKATAWFVEIESIEALTAFIERNGPCVVSCSNDYAPEAAGNIEIYNDYRE
jgi:hypothetical protein